MEEVAFVATCGAVFSITDAVQHHVDRGSSYTVYAAREGLSCRRPEQRLRRFSPYEGAYQVGGRRELPGRD